MLENAVAIVLILLITITLGFFLGWLTRERILKMRYRGLESQYHAMKKDVAAQGKSMVEKSQGLQNAVAELEAQTTKYNTLREQFQTCFTERAALQQSNEALAKTVEQTEQLLKDSQQNVSRLQETGPDLEIVNESLTKQAARLQEEKLKAHEKITQLQEQYDSANSDLNRFHSELDEAKARLAEELSANHRLLKDVEKLNAALRAAKLQSASTKDLEQEDKFAKIRARVSEIDFQRIGTASEADRDDLKKIKGIGPFLEQKLNSLGIYTFAQIARFTNQDEDLVNDIIEFFPGRIRRDQWVKQASELA